MWVDEKFTWKIHIQNIPDRCKKGINTMGCLTGNGWGSDRVAL